MLVRAVLLCLALPVFLSRGEVLSGEIIKLSYADESEALHLRAQDERLYTLRLSKESHFDLVETGVHAQVRGTVLSTRKLRDDDQEEIVQVQELIVDSGLARQKRHTWEAFTSVTYAIQMCNAEFGHDFERLKNNTVWLNDYLMNCTFGKYGAESVEANIVIGPIPLPCALGCTASDAYSWARSAQDYASKNLSVDVSSYKYHMFMLSPYHACNWAGLGTIGCTSKGCFSWFLGKYGYDIGVVMHELGHNFGLLHSTTSNNEYGDGSCIMGMAFEGSYRCYNAPQTLNLGAAHPKHVVTSVQGRVKFLLPIHMSTNASSVVIRMWSDRGYNYVLSYRAPISYDSYLHEEYHNKVFVHKVRGNGKTVLLAYMDIGGSYTLPKIGAVVCFDGVLEEKAHVSLYKGDDCSVNAEL